MNRVSRYNEIKSYTTKDGSQIRELIHPHKHGNRNQSIAEARVSGGGQTMPHHHRVSEEIYITTQGTGTLYIQREEGGGIIEVDLQRGVNVVIRPGERHWLENRGRDDLVILCCCSPAYGHDDTFLT